MFKPMTRKTRWGGRLVGSALACALIVTGAASADDDDQDRAREAMLAGEVRPLTEVLADVEKKYAGEILEVELEEEDDEGRMYDGEWRSLIIYEIKILTPQGNLVELEYDARTLELLDVDGHGSERARKDHEDDDEDDDDEEDDD